jgi:GntR family transcriptional regulator/MocR family aminotransferase
MIVIDKESSSPLYLQIFDAIARDITNHAYAPGMKLPATRRLASELNVSRNTVVNAYEQLVAEGYVSSRKGSGYIVRRVDYASTDPAQGHESDDASEEAENTELYDFEHSRPNAGLFPWKSWRNSMKVALETIDSHGFSYRQTSQGILELREVLARYLKRENGISAEPSQIVITCGHPYSIEVVATVFRDSADSFATEDPAYDGTCNVFLARGYEIETLPVEDDGVSIESLDSIKSRLLCLTPQHHFLTGARLSEEKHRRLLEWTIERNAYLVEDFYTVNLNHPRFHMPEDGNEHIIYLGTFSKALSPGIRAAYVVLPRKLLPKYRVLYQKYDMQVSVTNQLAIANFIESGAYDRHLHKLATFNEKRKTALVEAIQTTFKDRVSISGQQAGEHLLLDVKAPLDQQELVSRAEEHGVRVYPTEQYYLDNRRCPTSQVMIGFGAVPPECYLDAMTRLEEAWF